MNKIGLSHLMKAQKLHQGLPVERTERLQESVIGEGGVYLSYKSDFFDIVYQIEKFGKRTKEIMVRSKVEEVEEEIKFAEKIPSKYIYKMIAWYREVDKNSGAEATMQVFYDKTGEKELPEDLADKYEGSIKRDGNFMFIVPEQLISPGNVIFSGNKAVRHKLDTDLYDWAMSNLEPVLNMHSHNSMDAFWSGEDDANELPLYTRLCLVVGRVNTTKPMYRLSWNFEGKRHHQEVNVDEIFEPLEIDMNVSELGYSQKQTIGFNEGLEFLDFDKVSFDERWNERLVGKVVYDQALINQIGDHITEEQEEKLGDLLHTVGQQDLELEDFDHLGVDYQGGLSDEDLFHGGSIIDTSMLDDEEGLWGDLSLDLNEDGGEDNRKHEKGNVKNFKNNRNRVHIKEESKKVEDVGKINRDRGNYRGRGKRRR